MEFLNTGSALLAHGLRPMESVLFLTGIVLTLALASRVRNTAMRRGLPLLFAVPFYALYRVLLTEPAAEVWLYRLESPFLPPLLLLVLPAIYLPRTRIYRLFLVFPVLILAALAAHVVARLLSIPDGTEFVGLPVAPGMLALGVTAGLVLAQPALSLSAFRRVVRVTLFGVLMFGGFLLRQNATDYQSMTARRAVARQDIISFAETTPVLRDDRRLSYLPAAPCRFSADGGYVQGCSMELLQRLLQLDFRKVVAGSVEETALLAMALAALVALLVLLFAGGRIWCGWACPLATAGAALDRLRRLLHLPHVKPSQTLQRTGFLTGLSLGSFGLLLAAAIPRLDAQGRFLGCKIPLYPFCKFCPGQQVCPVASSGPGAYPPLPGREWMGGFFLVAALVAGLFFVASFSAFRSLFCRVCPMGMIGGIFNRGGLLALRKTTQRCNSCGICREVCPMNISSVAAEQGRDEVSSFDCLYCLECVARCPRKDCLRLEFAGHTVVRSDWPKPPPSSAASRSAVS